MCNWGGQPKSWSAQCLPSCTDLHQAWPSLMSSSFSQLFEKSRLLGALGTPSLQHNGRPKENAWTSLLLAPRNLPNLQSSLQVFINHPLSCELQTGIVSPLFTVVETKAEKLPTCLRSRRNWWLRAGEHWGFLTQAVGSHLWAQARTSCSCRFLYHRDLATQYFVLSVCTAV